MQSMTWGTLPTKEEFEAAFESECPKGTYNIQLGNSDSSACEGLLLGDGDWHSWSLWDAINEIVNKYHSNDDADDYEAAMDLVSSILATLKFEWV